MAKYLARKCPKCSDYLGVVVPEPGEQAKEVSISAACLRCGFELIWKVILGRKARVLLMTAFFPLLPASIFPHSGGLDAYGCHHDRERGGYHCHRGQFAGRSFGSQEEMLKQHKGGEPEHRPSGDH